jgi:hypothetical protein
VRHERELDPEIVSKLLFAPWWVFRFYQLRLPVGPATQHPHESHRQHQSIAAGGLGLWLREDEART